MSAGLTAAVVFVLAQAATPTPAPSAPAGPTFCVEWIRQSNQGYERLTLFRDGALVWKTVRGKSEEGRREEGKHDEGKRDEGRHEEVKREKLDAAESQHYCDLFAQNGIWSLPGDLRTRLASEFAGESAVTLARPDGSRKTVRFDDLSSHTADSSAMLAALDGLRGIFLSPLSPASRYTADVLPPGTLLRRFDGRIFRVRRLMRETGFVEIVGIEEPYSQFVKIDELRYQFEPPEHAP